jgi:DNA topoisomerase-1
VPKAARGKGTGDAVLAAIKRHADKHGHTVTLTPEPIHGQGGSKSKLTKWYERHGFVQNKGRNKDYEISESMYRVPSAEKSATIDELSLAKAAGPYIGPRGGKWADPQHTIPYKEPKGQKRAKPAKAKPKGSTTPKAKPGSQLPKEMYERLVELQCSRFPPADIPLSEIKVGDLHGSDIHERALLKYRTPKGKIQSGYTATFIARKAAEKFALVAKHKPVYAKIKRDVVSDLRKHEVGSGEHQAATVIAIIAHTGLRPGSAQSVRDHKRYGVTELRPEHVKIDGDTASFDYIGKSGEHNTATIRNKDIVAALKPYVDKAKRGQPIFERGTLGRANNQSIKGRELNLKDYRTIVGTIAAEKYLAKVKKPPPEVMGDNKRLNKYLAKTLNDASAHVADVLNNKPATARTSYIHPKVFEDWAIKELGVSPSLWEEVK